MWVLVVSGNIAHVWEADSFLWFCNRAVSQIPQCTSPILHNAPFCNRNVHISVTKWCIVGYLSNALWDLWDGSIASRDYQGLPSDLFGSIIRASTRIFARGCRDISRGCTRHKKVKGQSKNIMNGKIPADADRYRADGCVGRRQLMEALIMNKFWNMWINFLTLWLRKNCFQRFVGGVPSY